MIDWKDIHQDFTSDELQKKWKDKNFECEEASEWIKLGLKPTEVDYACWLRDIKQVDTEWVKNNNLAFKRNRPYDWLREEYNNYEYKKWIKLGERAILLIGNTGKGKSSLANVLINKNDNFEELFKESDGSTSETKKIQVGEFKFNPEPEKTSDKLSQEVGVVPEQMQNKLDLKENQALLEIIKYCVIDTPGIDDNREELPTEKILDIIAEAVYLVRNGVNRVFFVFDGRFDKYEMTTYDLLRVVIFSKKITNYTTVIRTNFVNYGNSERCRTDFDNMKSEGGRLSEVIKSCHGGIVHVDNQPTNKEKRKKSRTKLLNHLTKERFSIYKPPKLQKLSNAIVEYMEDKKHLEKKQAEGESQEKLEKKKLRRLRVKIDSDTKTKKNEKNTSEDKGTDSQEPVSNEEKKQAFEEVKKTEKRIEELKNKQEKLKEEMIEKETIIRWIIFKHIFNDIDRITKIEGGDTFIEGIKSGEQWKKFTKIEERVSKWVSESLNDQQRQKLVSDLKNHFGLDYISFCLWLINDKQLTAKDLSKAIEILENKIKVEHDVEFKSLKNEYLQLNLNEQFRQLEAEIKVINQVKLKEKWDEQLLLNIFKHFLSEFDKWNSGNKIVNELIKDYQLKAKRYSEILEWIPYERFTNIEYLAEGGFSKIYKAQWLDGPIENWSDENNKWEREGNKMVVLKRLNNSQNITLEFVTEIANTKLVDSSGGTVRCYGISQDYETKNYAMVMDYKEGGNLREYLRGDKASETSWEDKLYQLYTIILGLDAIHDQGLVHRDFHSGNILVDDVECYIIDLGLSSSVNEVNKKGEIYGVIPYVAPEVLMNKPYILASDIYSFGMIAYEVLTGLPPYGKSTHDMELMIKICQGFRPQFQVKIPQLLEDLINQCWNVDPERRPTSREISKVLGNWYNEMENKNSEIYRQVQEVEEFNKTLPVATRYPKYETHSVYTSKLINTKQITKLLQKYGSKDLELDLNDFNLDELNSQEDTQEQSSSQAQIQIPPK